MKAGGALVLAADAGTAARRAVREARAPLGALSPSFALLFASAHFSGSAAALVAAVVMGGMASGGLRSGQSLLFLDDRIVTHGAVGAHLPRAAIHPLVAQGCRPVGDPYTVTQADGNLIIELGGRPPLARLRELAAALPVREQELLARGAHLGIVIDEYQAEPGQGDFLVRGIAGADPESGAIAVGSELEVGQTVQFHVRDARSADEDLRRILVREAAALSGGQSRPESARGHPDRAVQPDRLAVEHRVLHDVRGQRGASGTRSSLLS